MTLKLDKKLQIDLADELLFSYEFDHKLNLDSIVKEVFDSSDEIIKSDSILLEDDKLSENVDSKCLENCVIKTSSTVDEPCNIKEKNDTSSRNMKRKKDINGNEELASDDNLNELFVNLALSDYDSDSDNEENDKSNLKERGKSDKRKSKNRDQNIIYRRNEKYDKSEISPDKLKFLSGASCQMQVNEPTPPVHFPIHNDLSTIFGGSEPIKTSFNYDLGCEDVTTFSVSSPESGYDSSAQSTSGTPPPMPLSSSPTLSFTPETVNEDQVLDLIVEISPSVPCKKDEKDPKLEKKKLYDYFREGLPSEYHESFPILDESVQKNVPLVIPPDDLQKSSFTLPEVSNCQASKRLEIPKKLTYKLDDTAKKQLQNFLSEEKYQAAKFRIYKRMFEGTANEKKIIYVEDKIDKSSENRTNLHHAVLNCNIEEIFGLVEIHKQYGEPLTTAINIRDKKGKTALDYAIQKEMTLVVNYLIENTACQSLDMQSHNL